MSVPNGQMLAMLSQMSPDQVNGILGLGTAPDEQQLLLQQLKQAQARQNTPMPQMGYSPRGSVTTAPSPFAVAGSVAQQVVGQQQAANIAQRQKAVLANQNLQRQNYWNLLMKTYGQQPPQQTPPTVAPGGGGGGDPGDGPG